MMKDSIIIIFNKVSSKSIEEDDISFQFSAAQKQRIHDELLKSGLDMSVNKLLDL